MAGVRTYLKELLEALEAAEAAKVSLVTVSDEVAALTGQKAALVADVASLQGQVETLKVEAQLAQQKFETDLRAAEEQLAYVQREGQSKIATLEQEYEATRTQVEAIKAEYAKLRAAFA